MITITIGGKKYQVKEAKTEQERSDGLKGATELQENEGMLFYLEDQQQQQTFTMDGMDIPLDIVFIDQDQEVVYVAENCQPGEEIIQNSTEEMDEEDYISYVLEVSPNSGIKVGNELEFEEKGPVMKVLFPDGSEQMALWGGERIFSRTNTRVLIKKARKAQETMTDSDYKALGKYMFKCMRIQDERSPEYVSAPTKEE